MVRGGPAASLAPAVLTCSAQKTLSASGVYRCSRAALQRLSQRQQGWAHGGGQANAWLHVGSLYVVTAPVVHVGGVVSAGAPCIVLEYCTYRSMVVTMKLLKVSQARIVFTSKAPKNSPYNQLQFPSALVWCWYGVCSAGPHFGTGRVTGLQLIRGDG